MLLASSFVALSVFNIVTATSNVVSRSTTATANITWQACPELQRNLSLGVGYGNDWQLQCSHLEVPLDYTNSNSAPLELALFRLNATKEPVLGSILINFGGPGGAGADNLYAWGSYFQKIIGEQWNLVTWDPRGTANTIPFACNHSSTASSTSPNRKRQVGNGIASANLTGYFVNGGWDEAGLSAQECSPDIYGIGQYISTAFVARDMIRIVDALGEDGLLRYYGWSYGTALGSYVAAMFSDRVERMVLDGNLNPYDYQSGTYGNTLIDADKAFTGFLTECLKEKENCALAQYTKANTTDDMLNAINLVFEPFAKNVSLGDPTALAVYSAVQSTMIYSSLYYPFNWPVLAEQITSVLNGSFLESLAASANTTAPTAPTVPVYNPYVDAGIGIRGADAVYRTDSAQEYLPHVRFQETVSHFDFGWFAAWISAQWKIVAKEQYTDNFNKTTKHPILYVNGEYDPITPLSNAYNASQGFVGSAVLPHNGYGHGLVVTPSECMNGYIQKYLTEGALPPSGARCEPDHSPWEYAVIRAADIANRTISADTANATSPASPTPSDYTSEAVRTQTTFIFGSILLMLWMLVL